MSDDLKSKATTAVVWDIVGKIITNGSSFIVFIFLARLLEPSEFGSIAIVMAIIGIATIFSDGGLGSALIQRKKVLPVHYSSVFYFNIAMAAILGLLTFFSAEWIADFYNEEELILLFQVMSAYFMIGAFSSVQIIRLRKKLNYALLNKIGIVASLCSGLIGIVLAFNSAGAWSLVAQYLSLEIITNILLWKVTEWRPSLLFSIKALGQLWRFGFHIFLVGVMNVVVSRMDVMIIGKLFTPETMGYFDRAKQLNRMILSYTSGSLMSVLFPVLSKIQNDLPRFQDIVIRIFGIISYVIFLLTGLLYLTAEELIVLLFSDKWLMSAIYFKILLLSVFSYVYSSVLMNSIISRGNSKLYFKLNIYQNILIVLNFFVLFYFTLEEFLYGYVFISVIMYIINIYYAAREIDLSIFLFVKFTLVQLIIGVFSVFITIFAISMLDGGNFITLVWKSSIFLLLYMGISWIFKTDSYCYFFEQLSYVLDKIKKRRL